MASGGGGGARQKTKTPLRQERPAGPGGSRHRGAGPPQQVGLTPSKSEQELEASML